MRAISAAKLILLDLNVLVTSDEEYKLWCSLLYSFFQSSVTSTLLDIKYTPRHPVLTHPHCVLPLT
jgi:hypothetical protein